MRYCIPHRVAVAFRVLGHAAPVLIACAGMLPALATRADAKSWKVEKKLVGKPDKEEPDNFKKSDTSEDISGIACATESGFPRICLVVDDEAQGAQIVILRDGELRAGTFIRLTRAAFEGKPLELDAEGVAYADGAFYVVGSHGRPRHAPNDPEAQAKSRARAEATRMLFRIRFDPKSVDPETGTLAGEPEITGSRALSRALQERPELKPFYDRPLEQCGVTIEGVAVRGGRLHAGLRGPLLDDGRAAILSLPVAGLFEGAAGTTELHAAWLGQDTRKRARGVRDLVALRDGFLILAGPVHDPDNDKVKAGDYAVFWWNGKDDPAHRADLDAYPDKTKPEGLLPLDSGSKTMRALIVFDGPEKGAPETVEIPLN